MKKVLLLLFCFCLLQATYNQPRLQSQQLIVYDVLGKVRYQPTIVPSTTTLHLQELSLGTYFLQLVDEQGSILFNNKFLKVK
jgi:hypothetical protein